MSRDSPTEGWLRILPSVTSLGEELRLLIFVAVQSLVLLASWRFVSRFVQDTLQRMIDTLLLTYVVQYAAVGLPGIAGLLSPIAMLSVAALTSIVLLALTPLPGAPGDGEGSVLPSNTVLNSRQNLHRSLLPAYQEKGSQTLIFIGGMLFVLGYLAAAVWTLRDYPVLSTDALTYHLPAAVQWLQHGRIDLFQTWLFNPANTYSPLAGSVFQAWLLGPIGNDSLAHFASAPMVVLMFMAVTGLARSAGASMPAAVLIAAGLAVSHPVISHVDKAKDDLFLAAFFAVSAGAMARERLQDRLGPWRLGAAIGLCLAVKYTALLALPMLLPALDAPIKARWRSARAAGCLAVIVLIAGPWYLRNAWLTGNPLFPTALPGLRGLFSTARSFELRSFRGVMGVLLNGTFAIPGWLACTVGGAWLLGVALRARQALRDPLTRVVLFGPPIGLVLLIALSPYPEIRFALPALVLAGGACGVLRQKLGLVVAIAFAAAAIGTGLTPELWMLLGRFGLSGVLLAGVGVSAALVQKKFLQLRREALLAAAALMILIIVSYTFVNWQSYLIGRRRIGFDNSGDARANLWRFVQEQVPLDQPVAYAGTFTVYPLMGFDLSRPVVYAPVRAGCRSIADLPYLGDRLSGEQIDPAAVAATYAQPERQSWLGRLNQCKATCLVVMTHDLKSPSLELEWARSMPDKFRKEYEDASGAVFRIIQ